MYSSVKFLSPIVTGGLPAPGLDELEVEDPDELDELDELDDELPHAASPSASTSAPTVALNVLMLPPGVGVRLSTASSGALGHHRHDREREVVSLLELHAARREHALDQRQRALHQQRQRRDADRGAEHARQVIARLVVDDVAEAAAVSGEGGDRGGRDDEQRRRPDSREDQRDPQRQLDLAQDLPAGQPHPTRGIDDVGIDAVDTDVGVGDDRWDRQHHQRQLHVLQPDPQERDADRQHGQARQRPPDVAEVDRHERTPMDVAKPRPDRDRDRESDRDPDPRDLQRLERQVNERRQRRLTRDLPVAADELQRLDECVGGEQDHVPPARVHGVSSRWVITRSPSAASASPTAIPPATISSVLNTSFEIADRIGAPRPSLSINDATVASEITVTVAIRTPAMIAGSASGSSTRSSDCIGPIPIPAAASLTSAGTSRSPVSVLRNMISSV